MLVVLMSVAPTRFGRCTTRLRSRYGYTLCTGAGFGRVGLALQRLDPHPSYQRRHRQPADRHALRAQQIAQHPAAGKQMLKMRRPWIDHGWCMIASRAGGSSRGRYHTPVRLSRGSDACRVSGRTLARSIMALRGPSRLY